MDSQAVVSPVLSAHHPRGIGASGMGPHTTPVALYDDVGKRNSLPGDIALQK